MPKPVKNQRKPIRRRPSTAEELENSVRYIILRDAYLQEAGILVRTGKRSWRLNPRR